MSDHPRKTYENGYNFTAVEMDWVVRGLFALQKQQPPEAAAIQQLINKLANTVYQVEPLTDDEIDSCFGERGWSSGNDYRLVLKNIRDKLREKNK